MTTDSTESHPGGVAVIGAGYGRTGTLSFKLALEQLGYGPCYHQLEAFKRPDHRRTWARAVAGEQMDWRGLFTGFRATSDWPACSFWKQIKAAHPEARVVLLRRDPDEWYDSLAATVLEMLDTPPPDATAEAWRSVMRTLIIERDFGGDTDRANAQAALRSYERDVLASVQANQLLVYEVAQGWEPLCDFLGADVPAAAFPRTNSAAQFRTMFKLDRPG